MAPVEHFREIIGIVEKGLIALLVKKWNMNTTVGTITMAIGVILITRGSPYKPNKLRRKREQLFFNRDRIRGVIGWNTDSDAAHYLVNRGIAVDYRDAERTEACDVIKALAKTNLAWKYKGESGRTIKPFGSHSVK